VVGAANWAKVVLGMGIKLCAAPSACVCVRIECYCFSMLCSSASFALGPECLSTWAGVERGAHTKIEHQEQGE
jgi:hypothetical protein